MYNLDIYGGIKIYRRPIVPNRVARHIGDIVKASSRNTPEMPKSRFPSWARDILEREYTR